MHLAAHESAQSSRSVLFVMFRFRGCLIPTLSQNPASEMRYVDDLMEVGRNHCSGIDLPLGRTCSTEAILHGKLECRTSWKVVFLCDFDRIM
jgi:hypothetical protein